MASAPSTNLATVLFAEQEKILACIHCGLCLEACPTYVITGDENDGPRGRIYLMRAVGEGTLANNSSAFERHIDRCLGCRACESVCPAGVEYGQLLEGARAELFATGAGRGPVYSFLKFVLRHVWLHRGRLKFAFACARNVRDSGLARLLLRSRISSLVSTRFEFGLALLESSKPQLRRAEKESIKFEPAPAGADTERASNSVTLFAGCVGEGLFARVNRATERVLAANGFAVSIPPTQVCCGALHAHAGDLDGARKLARQNLKAFGNDETPIVTNAGGCGAMLASYGHLLDDDEKLASQAKQFAARVRDVGRQLQSGNIRTALAVNNETVTYDASCHLLHGQHAADASLQLLRGIINVDFVPLEGAETCCGGAGVYNVLENEMSQEVLRHKVECVRKSGADVLATGNPGCQMQIGAGALLAGIKLRVCHPVELLDEAYRRAGFYD